MTRLLAGSMILPLFLAAAVTTAAPPTTTPAARASGPVDVAVEPFTRLGGGPDTPAWIGPAVQQNLISDLARLHFRPQAIDADIAPPAAIYLIRGSYQATGDTVRFDGQVLEIASGQLVGGIAATGPVRDLFGLEDAVSAQAIHQLRELTSPADVAPPVTQAILASAVQPPSAAPTLNDGYDGSVLQAYVNANTAPSNDYIDQEAASRVRQTYFNDFSTGLAPYGYGEFGGFGVFSGTSFYPFGLAGFGYGRGGYGGFGYGGRFGYAGLGRGAAFGYGGNYGYGFGGGGFAGGGAHGGGFGR